MISFAAYEFALLVVSLKIAVALSQQHNHRFIDIALLAGAIKIFIACALAIGILFFASDHALYFRIALFALILTAIAPFRWPNSFCVGGVPPKPLLLVLILGPLLIAPRIYPLFEIDSHSVFNEMLGWLQNDRSPYTIVYEYVSFWEAGFVPAIVLAETKYATWWHQLQAIALLLVAVYALARECRLDQTLALLVAISIGLLPALWFPWSGLATLKNDVIANVGFIVVGIVVLRAFNNALDPLRDGTLFGIGCGFAACKYSGIIQAGPLALLILTVLAVSARWRKALTFSLVAFALFFMSAGHFYMKNAVMFGNPLYPIRLNILGLTLPGSFALKGTSILENFEHAALWCHLFQCAGPFPHRLGLLFPIAVVALVPLTGALLLSGRGLRSSAVALLAVFAWLVFASSPWSSGVGPGDFFYIRTLNTTRYATAAIAFTFVAVTAIVVEFRPALWPLCAAALGANAAIRFIALLLGEDQARLHLSWPYAVFMFALAATLLMTGILLREQSARRVVAIGTVWLIALPVVLMLAPIVSRHNGERYHAPFRNLERAIDSLKPVRLSTWGDATTELELFAYGYHALGTDVRRELRIVTPTLHARPEGSVGDAIVLFRYTGRSTRLDAKAVAALDAQLGPSWARVYADDDGALYSNNGLIAPAARQ